MTKEIPEKNPAAVALGRMGGLAKPKRPRGFAALTAIQRREIGRTGGQAKARNKAKESQ